ncbi:YqaE/Pmp3 family membrane protein [Chryseobacterium pennae]|uniref:YqaE/Pmp3 family membrane protein n=2 Tax=Chryseobacterium group TaxID=2782232 RepID=A0A3D9CC37_9FLAO|nr:YqaE/Pmp3 family membrane protein [Chryseobacterium pennae]
MMFLAIVLPFLSFIVRGKVITGIICFILQITLIGWLPAAIWAVMSLNNERANQRNEDLIRAVREGRR